MIDCADDLQSRLLASDPDYAGFAAGWRACPLSNEARAISRPLVRLALALHDFTDGRAGTADLAVLLRQAIRTCQRSFTLPLSLWQLITNQAPLTGLRPITGLETGLVEVKAESWRPVWLPGAESIDCLNRRRSDIPALGDGLLYAFSGKQWTGYQSAAQKACIAACLFAPPGQTTLVTLPTGAGKSLCALLPAWHSSQGGRIKGGSTIVIMPTVSLALDQERQARKFFEEAGYAEFAPLSLTGAADATQRATVRDGLRYGTLSLLFLSPEALLNTDLREIVLNGARAGSINTLVIDEAHVVQTWGAGFRTEFQFLATYRKQLLGASEGRLRTVLLSATITPESETLLQRLFAEDGSFTALRANRLRPEPEFWFDEAPNWRVREERVLEALFHLPRPAILYVTRPEEAETWIARLRGLGFARIEAFTGRTESAERLRVLDEWTRDMRDIMVATSAFGLGVDKSDVRTVLHATLPENLNRFYQEVGRGGRDGFSSVSLLCTCPGDDDLAFRMTSNARITTEQAWARWLGIWRTAQQTGNDGDHWVVDLFSVPTNNPEMRKSQINREWNEHTLLLMQRSNLISIEDLPARDWNTNWLQPDQSDVEPAWLALRVLDPLAIQDPSTFLSRVGETRTKEREEIWQALRGMKALVRTFSKNSPVECLAYTFAQLYPDTALACGGCPTCRKASDPPYASPLELLQDGSTSYSPQAPYLRADLRELLGERRQLHADWEGMRSCEPLKTRRSLLAKLVWAGCQQLILPDELAADRDWMDGLMQALARECQVPHWVLREADVVDRVLPLLALPTVVLYPPDDSAADRLYQELQRRFGRDRAAIWQVSIIPAGLWLASERGLFNQRVNGLKMSANEVEGLLDNWRQPGF
jgi:superfamily II DNA/RNA helicase